LSEQEHVSGEIPSEGERVNQKATPGKGTQGDVSGASVKKISSWRLWLFRLLAVSVVPAALFGLLELALRVAGFGYATDFMVKAELEGRDAYWENLKFGWRFFPKHLSRVPSSFIVDAAKPARTYRIFVLGGSAAQGYPDFSYAFGRILEVMLRKQYPGVNFEVVNAAVTAINSHVVLEIAKNCSKHDSDMFIVYMGNNEVVGPFGPGTIFKSFSPSLSAIRANVAFKKTKVGQLVDKVLGLATERDAPKKWAGMEMFLRKQIRFDDPGMESVYSHFERNLRDIWRVARESGTKVVVSTVASDLKDCPPFASLHRADITEKELVQWQGLYESAIGLENSGAFAKAVEQYRAAEKIDGGFADMHFRLGRCLWDSGLYEQAHKSFAKARDLDSLRFRADTRINEIIRMVAKDTASGDVGFVDAVEVIGRSSLHGIAGERFFWEHVHMNFAGNYLLARSIFDEVAKILPDWVRKERKGGEVLSRGECAKRLAHTTWDRRRIASKMIAVVETPPFTNQLYHFEHVATMRQELAELEVYKEPEQVEADRAMYREAIDRAKDDSWLYFNYGVFLQKVCKEPEASADALRTACRRMPQYAAAFNQLGVALNQLGQTTEAIGLFETALRLRPNNAHILHNNLGVSLQKEGDARGAIAHYKKAIELDPNYVLTYNNLGALLNKQGRYAEAVEYLSEAIRLLPGFLQARRNLDAAMKNLERKNSADIDANELKPVQ